MAELTRERELLDALWVCACPLLTPRLPPRTGRCSFAGIVHVLRPGCQWWDLAGTFVEANRRDGEPGAGKDGTRGRW
jgi:transposase